MGDWTSQNWTKRDGRNNQEQQEQQEQQQEKKATYKTAAELAVKKATFSSDSFQIATLTACITL